MPKLEHNRPIGIGLDVTSLDAVACALERLLGDCLVLYVKTRNFHWNVEGMNFKPLHSLFEEQYEALDEELDCVAERLRALSRRAPGSMKEFLEASTLRESTAKNLTERQMVAELLADHEALARALRLDISAAQKAGDDATADFFTGLLETHEKTAWMLRATLG